MRILFLSENFPPETNAAAARVYERAVYWTRWGHEVTVLTTAPNFPDGKLFAGYANRWRQVETMSGIRVVRVKSYIAPNRGTLLRTLDFLSFMANGFIAGLFERRPDVVAANSPQFFTAVAGWALAAAKLRPFVFEVADLWPKSILAVGAMKRGRVLRLIERLELFLYRRAAVVVALTDAFKHDIVGRGISAEKVAVVRNGVDLPRYSPRPRDQDLAKEWGLEDKFVVGYVGTHGMAHGLMNVIEAAAGLTAETNIAFLLVGAGAERDSLIAAARRRKLGNIVFMPAQPKARMPAVWSLCDVALVHLRNASAFAEVVPSKIFEAMAMGLPILLAAPRGEASELIEAEGVGLSVTPGDPAALAQAVTTLRDQETMRRRYARNARSMAPEHSRERQARDTLDALLLAASGRGGEAAAIRSRERGASEAGGSRAPH
ncbi:MAG: glycosyltransferase family 4 protein [Proteobacteria bacterium]|nr:glycosyltransferase family 4 protein [Pseudomonadota bacterium]